MMNKKWNILSKKREEFLYKNFIRILAMLAFLIIIVCLAVYYCISVYQDNNIEYQAYSDASYVENISDTILKDIELNLYRLATNDNVRLFFCNIKSKEHFYQCAVKTLNSVSQVCESHDCIESVYVYSFYKDVVLLKDELLNRKVSLIDFKNLQDNGWYDEYKNQVNETSKVFIRKFDENNNIITYIYKIDTNGIKGAIIINVNINQHMKFSKNDFSTFVVDTNGNVAYKSRPTFDFPVLKSDIKKNKYITIDKGKPIVIAAKQSNYSWKYYVASEIENYYVSKISLLLVIFLSMIGLIIVGYFVAVKFASIAYKPIRNIATILENPFSEETKKYLTNDVTTKYIAEKISAVMLINENLKLEVSRKTKEFNNAQLMALQFQINPHFIFNTLNLFYLISTENLGEEHCLSKGMMSLSKTLRYCFKSYDILVSVEEEINNAKEYLKIMKLRTKNSFEEDINCEEGILQKKVVKMCLQPILENCFQYGFNIEKTAGKIFISAYTNDEFLYLKVHDNGSGISFEKLNEINYNLDLEKNVNHVGINNVHQRIRLLYGKPYGVTVQSTPKYGTTVILTFPNS